MTGFLCALPLIAGLLSCPTDDVLAVGYVEGEYVRLAPVGSAELVVVAVRSWRATGWPAVTRSPWRTATSTSSAELTGASRTYSPST